MVPTKFMNEIILGNLARAQRLYPVQIVAFVFERNHFHLILIVKDPEHVSAFVGYLKQEIAHAINRLLGRRKRTIWCEEYDSPTLLDFETMMKYLVYLYTQPQKDSLTETMDEYPGVSSWNMLLADQTERRCSIIPRDVVPRLRNPQMPWREDEQVQSELEAGRLGETKLLLSPFAWKECFPETKHCYDHELKSTLIARVRQTEEQIGAERRKAGSRVKGATALRKASMLEAYTPIKFGKKMFCLASCKQNRIPFIAWVKGIIQEAKHVYQLWKRGHTQVPYPAGLFSPPLPRLQNVFFPLVAI